MAIFRYSEIDLSVFEIDELATGLVDLVYRKSKTSLEGVALTDITARVGVGLDDLLSVLSISRAAYDSVLAGAEPKALRAASVIQRWLKGAGADDSMIEFASQQKVNWDIWASGCEARVMSTPLTSVHAPNGSGKTPIVQSVAYCLGFDTKFRDDIQEKCQAAVLTFEQGGHSYTVTRELTKEFHVTVTTADSQREFFSERDFSKAIFEEFSLTVPVLVGSNLQATLSKDWGSVQILGGHHRHRLHPRSQDGFAGRTWTPPMPSSH
jgi:AAA domain-containing protein